MVYKNIFFKSQIVAIKKMDLPSFKAAEGEREFRVEVDILSRLDHPNLVSLIGYCADGKHRFLVYEYMPRGNLQDHLNGLFVCEFCTTSLNFCAWRCISLTTASRYWRTEDGLAFETQSGSWSSKRTCISPFQFCCRNSYCTPRLQINQYPARQQLWSQGTSTS